jgi:tRNA(adenine34) deaminase
VFFKLLQLKMPGTTGNVFRNCRLELIYSPPAGKGQKVTSQFDLKTLAESFKNRLSSFKAADTNEHDKFILICLHEAVAALEEGNYGVGAALIRDNVVLKLGRNQVFAPHFRSDLHAEMAVLNAYEEDVRGSALIHRDSILYTSVEPCVMCFARILSAGIKRVF